MNTNCWIGLQALIDEQLELQVNISFPQHYHFMLENGLEDCQTVMDLGTGNGCFLAKVASEQPKINFYGIDNKPHMITAAQKSIPQNIKYQKGDINNLATLPDLQLIDGILMRYLILHIPNIKEILVALVNNMRPGTTLWIFDLDINNFNCDPYHDDFNKLKKLVERFCSKYSIESTAASKMPVILKELGLNNIKTEAELFTNKHIEQSLFQQFILNEVELYHQFLGDDSNQQEVDAIKSFIQNQQILAQHKIQYGMVMISACLETRC